MSILHRVATLLLVLVSFSVLCAAQSQSQAQANKANSSVAGHVTMGGKDAPGITVVATLSSSFFENKTVARTITDEAGNYKLSALSAGRLTITPLAKAFVVVSGSAYKQPGQTVNLGEAEVVTKIDFTLVRGGVITGRITDTEGHPLIAERVSVTPKDSGTDAERQAMMMLRGIRNQTDDRGIYRMYGLGPGSYRVSVGQAASAGGGTRTGFGGSNYVKTFYPGVQDEARATIIEIKEGTEVGNVDIIVGKLASGFAVAGRVVDADSGQPVGSVYIGHATVTESNQQLGSMSFSGSQTDATGNFRLEGFRPGHYAVFAMPTGAMETSAYGEPAVFDIADGDVSGIEIKMRRGATLSGVAVVENSSDPAVGTLLQGVTLYAYVQGKGISPPANYRGPIGPDGSFRLGGLAPGKVRIGIMGFPAPPKSLTLLRTELDGLEQPDGIEIAAGAQLGGVRLIFAYGTGTIRGEVKVEGGTLPEGTSLQVSLRPVSGDSRRPPRGLEIDGRNHFSGEHIPPGNYELVVRVVTRDTKATPAVEVKQNVTIVNGTEVTATLTVDLSAKGVGR